MARTLLAVVVISCGIACGSEPSLGLVETELTCAPDELSWFVGEPVCEDVTALCQAPGLPRVSLSSEQTPLYFSVPGVVVVQPNVYEVSIRYCAESIGDWLGSAVLESGAQTFTIDLWGTRYSP